MGIDGSRVDLKLFIEGVEVPVLSVTVNEVIGSMTECMLRVPYRKSVEQLLPRSIIHLYYKDQTGLVNFRHEVVEGTSFESTLSTSFVSDQTGALSYKLLFWGEFAGMSRFVNAAQREVQLVCWGWTNYFDTIQLAAAQHGQGTLSDIERKFVGTENPLANMVTTTVSTQAAPTGEPNYSEIVYDPDGNIMEESVEIIESSETTTTTETTASSGQYSTADRITQLLCSGGTNFQSGLVALIKEFIRGSNTFFRDRMLITRLDDMIRAIDNDQTLEHFMNMRLFRRFVRQALGGRGMYTLRGILNELGKIIFHDLVEHAAPTYFPFVSSEVAQQLNTADPNPDVPVVTRANQRDILTGFVFKPELWWTCPPACNVLFPNQYESINVGKTELAEPTRTILKVPVGVSAAPPGEEGGSRRTICDNYFAPDSAALNDLATSTEFSLQSVFQLPHEQYRGILANVMMLGEVARLVRRADCQDYMKSYAQFAHWSATYGKRMCQLTSSRHLPQVLVGYPVIAIDPDVVTRTTPVDDPNLEERLRLRRMLAALRRCLARLRRRLGPLLEQLRLVTNQVAYLRWLADHADELAMGDHRGENDEQLMSMGDEQLLSLVADQPYFQLGDAVRFTPNEDPPPPGRAVPTGDQPVQENDATTPSATANMDIIPAYDGPTLTRYLGGDAAPVIPDDTGCISLNPTSSGFVSHLNGLIERMLAAQASLEGQIGALRAKIALVERAISDLRDRVLALGSDTGNYDHVIFYAQSKSTTIIREGKIQTSISGGFSRSHEEDIDLDGARGDCFENIIKTGAGGFFSDNYSADKIGREFYHELYGVGSMIDVALALQPYTTRESDVLNDTSIAAANEEEPDYMQRVREICGQEFAAQDASEGFSIADGLEILIDAYRSFGNNSVEIEQLTARLTARPVATMLDILGAEVLQNPNLVASRTYGNYQGSQRDSGVGFQQFAFATSDNGFDTTGLEGGESDLQAVAIARRRRVEAYVQELGDFNWTT
jgi:hypothetical protein